MLVATLSLFSSLLALEWGLQGLREAVNIHPLFVHFPIGLLLSAAAFYFLGFLLRHESLLIAGQWTLYLGTVSAYVTVWTGLEAAETVSHAEPIHQLIWYHKYFGYGIAVLASGLSLWSLLAGEKLPRKARIVFLGGLGALGLLITQGADLGGRMVFLHGAGVKQAVGPVEGGTPEVSQQPPIQSEEGVTIVGMTNDLKFEPERVTIQVGETVEWRNTSFLVHTVTADPAKASDKSHVALPEGAEVFDSGDIEPEGTYRRTFEIAGTYRYFCIPHEASGMVGEVIVEE